LRLVVRTALLDSHFACDIGALVKLP